MKSAQLTQSLFDDLQDYVCLKLLRLLPFATFSAPTTPVTSLCIVPKLPELVAPRIGQQAEGHRQRLQGSSLPCLFVRELDCVVESHTTCQSERGHTISICEDLRPCPCSPSTSSPPFSCLRHHRYRSGEQLAQHQALLRAPRRQTW